MVPGLRRVQAKWHPSKKYPPNFSDAGYDIPQSTLRTWEARLRSHLPAVDYTTIQGRPKALSEEQEKLLVGHAVHMNSRKLEFHGKTAAAFLDQHFGLHVTPRTASTYLTDAGFSSRLAMTRAKGYTKTVDELALEITDWISDRRKERTFAGLCASVDFTFTSHRTARQRTYSPRGGQAPKLRAQLSRFTNCIVTCEWSDGVNRTPAILFTYNPEFRRDRNSTARRQDQVAHLTECLENSHVDPARVVYIGRSSGETRTYVTESADLIRRFFEHYDDGADVVFSDNGKSFKEEDTSVLVDAGFKRHVYYPADVHQFLSPNDNKLHGAAKQKWRQSGSDFKDDVHSSILLLHYLDGPDEATRKKWWRENFILGGRVSRKKAINIIVGNKSRKDAYFRQCYELYKQKILQ